MRVFLLLVAVILSGCTTVQPWERGHLADERMIIGGDPIAAGIQTHHLDYREGSAGGTGAQSGGCGCE